MTFTTEFDTDVIADASALWDFRSPVANGSYAIADDLLSLTGTGTAARDTVTNTTSTDSTIAATHPFTPAAAGGPNHDGSFFVVAELATDLGWRKAWGINVLALNTGGNGCARACVFKLGTNDGEFPNFFFSTRHDVGNGVALNNSVNQSGQPWLLMTGMPAYLGLQHTPATGAPLSADMPAAGIYRQVYSVDGWNWVTVTGAAGVFEPTEIRFGYSKATQGTMGTFQLARVVDMLALGNGSASWDLRRTHPDHERTVAYGWAAGDGALDPAYWADDSRSPGGTSTVVPGASGITFSHTLTPDARQGVRARLKWVGPTFSEGRLTIRGRCTDDNSSGFLTLGLVTDMGDPPQVPLSSASSSGTVLTLGTGSAHGLKQGQIVRAVFPNAPTYNVTGSPAASASGTAMTITQTASAGSVDVSGGAYLQKVEPWDQYSRGPGLGLEFCLGAPAGVNVRRPIRMDWRGVDYQGGDLDVFSIPGSTGLNETGYQHSRQIDDAATTATNPAITVVIQLERFDTGDGQGHRFRCRRWVSVSADIATDIAHGDDAELAWDYIDSEDQVSRAMGYAAFVPAISLSHNAAQSSTAQYLVSWLGMEEITAASGGGAGGGRPLPRARWRRRSRR